LARTIKKTIVRAAAKPLQLDDNLGEARASTDGYAAPDPNLSPGRRSVASWFETAAFSQPASFSFGNERLGIVRSIGWAKSDISLLRNFSVTDGPIGVSAPPRQVSARLVF
jgi:hypothetical protein